MKVKKNCGWVLRSTSTGYYLKHTTQEVRNINVYLKPTSYYGNEKLESARVFPTRALARAEKSSWERVFKVITNARGQAILLIPGR